jgi:hypothetical protein
MHKRGVGQVDEHQIAPYQDWGTDISQEKSLRNLRNLEHSGCALFLRSTEENNVCVLLWRMWCWSLSGGLFWGISYKAKLLKDWGQTTGTWLPIYKTMWISILILYSVFFYCHSSVHCCEEFWLTCTLSIVAGEVWNVFFCPSHKPRQVLAFRISYTWVRRTGMSRIVVSSSFTMWNYQELKKLFFIGFIRFLFS